MSATQNARTAALEAVIVAHATELKLPTIRRRFKTLAEEATREQQPPVAYLAALLITANQAPAHATMRASASVMRRRSRGCLAASSGSARRPGW